MRDAIAVYTGSIETNSIFYFNKPAFNIQLCVKSSMFVNKHES